MNGYDGPSIDSDAELIRQHTVQQHSRSSAWSNMRFERALIKRFSPDGNIAEVQTDDDELYPAIRIQTPLDWILFFYGETDKLRDIPCLLVYRSTPQDGWCFIGDLLPKQEEEGIRSINEPFYL